MTAPKRRSSVGLWLGGASLIAAVLLVLGGLAYWKYRGIQEAMKSAGWQEQPEMVVFATSQAVEYRPSVTAIGTVVASRWIELKNELAGTIKTIELAPGSIVEAGQTLVSLDVSVEHAELASAESRLRLAEQMLQRQQQAAEARAGSQMELDRAQAEFQQAQAEIERIKAVIDRKSLRAPFRARVGLSNTHLGQYLAEGTPITTLQALDGYAFVDFSLTETNALGVTIGQKVQAELPSGELREATIIATDTLADPSTRNVTFRARIADEAGLLRPGSSLRLTVERGRPITLVGVPVSALRRTPQGEMVYTVSVGKDQQTRAKSTPVRGGPTIGELTLLRAGLDPGTRIIAAGSFKLHEGALVADAGTAPAAAPASGTEPADTGGKPSNSVAEKAAVESSSKSAG